MEFENDNQDFEKTQNILCWISSIITTILSFFKKTRISFNLINFLVGLTIIRRKWMFLLKQARKSLAKKKYSVNSIKFILEILIILPHSTPYTQNFIVNFHTNFQMKSFYKLNEIFNLLVLLRIYIILRFFIITSKYYDNRAQRTCAFYAVKPNYWLSLKFMLKTHPYIIISLSMLFFILIFAEAIRICERFIFN